MTTVEVKQDTGAGVANLGTFEFAVLPRLGEILVIATTQDVCATVLRIEHFPAVFLPGEPERVMVTAPNVVLWIDRIVERHVGKTIAGGSA